MGGISLIDLDEQFMRRALSLAERGLGGVSPNPAVGAVIAKEGQVVGEGYHQQAGLPHAEAIALGRVKDAADGATLYVTLEPCCHWGRTAPCVDQIIASRIGRVAIAMLDPNPKVAGSGAAALKRAGITVDVGLLGDEALRLNEAYVKHMATGLPFTVLKYAMTIDGKIATKTGDSRWISCKESRRLVHQMRGRVDVVITGVETVLRDDPELSCRLWEWGTSPPFHQPARVILDSMLRVPVNAKLISRRPLPDMTATASAVNRLGGHVFVATTNAAPIERRRRLEEAGARVLLVSSDEDGRVSIESLLQNLGQIGVTSVLLEGGPILNAAFLGIKAVDKVMAFVCPKIVGGQDAPGPIADLRISQISDSVALADLKQENIGGDILITGYLKSGRGA